MEHFNILLRFIRLICVNYKQANEMTQKKPWYSAMQIISLLFFLNHLIRLNDTNSLTDFLNNRFSASQVIPCYE
jgi:hypothetical protein